ncbi:MAG: TraB/GumN family protein [Gammaproteobacteria bacterium]
MSVVGVLLLIGAWSPPGVWALDCEPLPATGSVARHSGRFDRGLLFQVTKAGHPGSHVFGTIHVGDPRVLALPKPVSEAFENSRGLVIEVMLDERGLAAFSTHMLLEPGKSLPTEIGQPLFERAAPLLERYAIPREAALRLRPWVVFTTLNLPPPTDLVALDLELMRRAQESGKGVQGLESVEEQAAALSGLPLNDQIALLNDAVCHYDALQREVAGLLRAYLDRDLGMLMALALYRTSERYQASGQDHYSRLMDSLLWKRNRLMVERMAPRLAEGSSFIAIGALHLAGERGVLALLEDLGYRVSRVY